MDIAALGVRIDSNGVVQTTRELQAFEGQAGRTERATDGLSRAFRMLGPLVGAVSAAFSVRALVQYADAWSDMSSRVGAAIKDMAAAPTMMKRLVDMANASYSPLEQTVSVYARNVGTLRDLGYAANDAADFTEALNHALVITATRGERAQSVQDALSKAMATGRLQADGLETVLANGGRVAEALAAELGTTVSGLRGMASQGKITGDVIARALTGRLSELRDEAAEMPATIGDAFVRINNNTTAFIGTLDKAWGVSSRVAEGLLGMADGILAATDTFLRLGNIISTAVGPAFDLLGASLGSVTQYAGIAVAALSGFYAPALLGGIGTLATAIGVGVVGAIRAVGQAMMANPLGLFIAGLAAAVTAAFMFRDEIKQAIGVDVVGVMVDVGNKTIGVFVGAYEAVKEQWSNLPTFFSAIGKMAWNNFLESFEGPALTIETPWGKWESAGLDLSGAKAPLSRAEQQSFNKAGATFNDAYMNGTYIDNMASGLGEMWDNAAGAGDAIGSLAGQLGGGSLAGGGAGAGGGLAGAAKAANDNIKTLADQTNWFATAAQSAFSNMGTSIVDAFKKGGDVGRNVLEMLLDKVGQLGTNLLNSGLNSLFGGLFGGGFGGQWGVAGGFAGFKGIFGIPGMATGGTVGREGLSWVGEQGPELLRLPRGAEVIPNGPSLAMAANQNSGGDIVIHNVINVPAGTSPETAPAIAREVTKELRKQLPDALDRYNRNPLRRAG